MRTIGCFTQHTSSLEQGIRMVWSKWLQNIPRKNKGHAHLPFTNHTHKVFGLTLDSQLTCRSHIENVKAKCSTRLNFLKHLAGTQWRAAQSTLIRVHKMLVLLAMEFESTKDPTEETLSMDIDRVSQTLFSLEPKKPASSWRLTLTTSIRG
jgi:hypothetical protein